MYQSVLRPLFFQLAPEKAHHLSMRALQLPGMKSFFRSPFAGPNFSLEREYWGIRFKNPLGLAAGFDKNGEWIDSMETFGFGFVEIGTVTPKPQMGNPQPRLFRLKTDEALINRMGFNNAGLDAVRKNLEKRRSSLIVGGNIGKNKATPNAEAFSDYKTCFLGLHDLVDYFVVNVSSPNTPNLRELQDREPLRALLMGLQTLNAGLKQAKPILLKIAPDLSQPQLENVVEVLQEARIPGVVATNTTIRRKPLKTSAKAIEAIGAGGLSGKPLEELSNEILGSLRAALGPDYPIIGVGGIRSALTAQAKLDAGANLLQIYTGFVYGGPGLPTQILKNLRPKPEKIDSAELN